MINSRKVVLIGCGFVGASSAFALMQSNLFSEMVLIDADRSRAEGEALDISHGRMQNLRCDRAGRTVNPSSIKSDDRRVWNH